MIVIAAFAVKSSASQHIHIFLLSHTVDGTCEVTFSKSPTNAEVVVKQSGNVVSPDGQGKYHLAAGSYTYTASATGYTTQSDVALTISASDVTTELNDAPFLVGHSGHLFLLFYSYSVESSERQSQ